VADQPSFNSSKQTWGVKIASIPEELS